MGKIWQDDSLVSRERKSFLQNAEDSYEKICILPHHDVCKRQIPPVHYTRNESLWDRRAFLLVAAFRHSLGLQKQNGDIWATTRGSSAHQPSC